MADISERLKIETSNNIRYIFVDYTGLREKEMIELVKKHQELTLQTKLSFIADFHKTYATTGYVLHGKHFVETTKSIIDKGAFLGVDKVKSFILQAILLTHNVNFKSFGTKQEAIDFITKDKTSDVISG
eukprot:Opistho-1_new@79625